MSSTIQANSKVTLHFEVALEDGTLIDTTRNRAKPVTFQMGDGSLLPGFEKTLLDLKAGDKKSSLIQPEDGFGVINPKSIYTMPRTHFKDNPPEIGLIFSFEQKNQHYTGRVTDIVGDNITVDFNHPLAGKTLLFNIEIFDVIPVAELVS